MSEPTFNPGDRVWQHKHAPDGYRFEIVGSSQAANGETLYQCKQVGQYEVATSYDGDDNLIRTPIGIVLIEGGDTIEIRASALALAED